VLLGDQLTVFDLLVSFRAKPAALVLSEAPSHAVARTLLSMVQVPTVVEVQNLFRWAVEGDLALVDGDHGLVRLSPSRVEVNRARAHKRGGRANP
jgi:phosphotransferase system enzyme I (PtsP)